MAKRKAKHKYTAAEIRDLVMARQQSKEWQDMLTQFEEHFDLWTLTPYQPEKDHQAYTSPGPRNDFNKVFHAANKADLVWQIGIQDDAPESEREAANKGERLIAAVLDSADRELMKRGEPPLRIGYNWFGCVRGCSGLTCLIYQDEADKDVQDIRPLDPMHTIWVQGATGMIWWAHVYHISAMEARESYGVDVGDTTEVVEFINFFDRHINAQVLTNTTAPTPSEFIKKPTEHKLDHVPTFVGFVGGMPTIYSKEGINQLQYRAQSVYSASAGIYAPFNKYMSFMMDVVEKAVAGTLLLKSRDGNFTLKRDPYSNWNLIPISTERGEEITPLQTPPLPPAAMALLEKLDREKQEATVPFPIGYGLDNSAHSGAALAIINENMRSNYDPFTDLIKAGWIWLCREILGQFKAKGRPMKLRGYGRDDKYFEIDVDPEDIKDDWYINVTCEPKLPRDQAGEMMMATQARQPRRSDGSPMLSDLTIREKVLKIQNPDAEETRIEDEAIKRQIAAIPDFAIAKMAERLRKKGDREGAKMLLSKLNAGSPQPNGGPQPQPPGVAVGTPGAGQADPRITLQVMAQELAAMPPAEQQQIMAQMPPDLLAAMQEMMAQIGSQAPIQPPAPMPV